MASPTLDRSPITGEPFRKWECRRPVALRPLALDTATGELTPMGEVLTRCGSWRCPGCGRRLRALHIRLVKAGVEHHAARGRFARLLTVTFPTDTGALATEAEDCARVTALVTRLVQEVRRTHSPRMEYYAAKETTKRGRLHVHLVTTGPYLRKCRLATKHRPGETWRDACAEAGGCVARLQAWEATGGHGRRPKPCVQAIARRLGLGFVDIRKVRGTGEAAAYVAKYLGKQVGAAWPRYSRRAAYSRGRLQCPTHPDQAGRRCCPEATPRTFYAPETIGALSQRAADTAYLAGVAAGRIDPDDRHRFAGAHVWHFLPLDPRPPPDPIPNDALPEAEVVRRYNARLDAWLDAAQAAGIVHRLERRVPAEVAAAAAAGPLIPRPGLG